MLDCFAPVPVHGRRLRRRAAGGFMVTESIHTHAVGLHSHRYPMIVLCVEGAFEETYTGAHGRVESTWQTVFVRPAGAPHANRFGPRGARDIAIEVTDQRLAADATRSLLGAPTSWQGGRWSWFADRLRRELTVGDSATPIALEALVLELIATLARTPDPSEARLPAWLRAARDRLAEAGEGEPFTVAEVARQVGVHPVHLARAFRRHFGVGPGDFIRSCRLDRAFEAVRNGGSSLAEIAARTGFADQSHFTKAFRRKFGVTPARWRLR